MIQLSEEQQQFVDSQVASGEYNDSSEVVRAGIELLRKAADRSYAETVQEIQEAIPDMQAGRGLGIEEVDRSIREKLGFTKPS